MSNDTRRHTRAHASRLALPPGVRAIHSSADLCAGLPLADAAKAYRAHAVRLLLRSETVGERQRLGLRRVALRTLQQSAALAAAA